MPVSDHPNRIIQVDAPKRTGLGTTPDPSVADYGAGNFHRVHDAIGQANTLTDPADPDSGLPIDSQDRNLINLWALFDTDAAQTITVAVLLYRADGKLGQVQETILSATSTQDETGKYISEPQFIPANGFPGYRVRNVGTNYGLADIYAGTL